MAKDNLRNEENYGLLSFIFLQTYEEQIKLCNIEYNNKTMKFPLYLTKFSSFHFIFVFVIQSSKFIKFVFIFVLRSPFETSYDKKLYPKTALCLCLQGIYN